MKNLNRYRILTAILVLLMGSKVQSQDIHFSQFYDAPLMRNPSLAGIFTGDVRIQMVYRDQWRSVTNAYRSGSLNAEYKCRLADQMILSRLACKCYLIGRELYH